MINYLVDTDILSYFLKGNEKVKNQFLDALSNGNQIKTSIINYYEIRSGLLHKKAHKQLKVFDDFCDELEIIQLSKESVQYSASV